jgi:hypothetical protein
MARQTGTDLGEVKTTGRSNKPKVSDKIEIYEIPPKKWVTLRLHGPTFSYCTYWVRVKKKDGKWTKFPVDSPSYDPKTQDFDTTKYDPWIELWKRQQSDGTKKEDQLIQVDTKFYIDAISRAAQKNEPRSKPGHSKSEKKTGFKEKGSDSWTPNVALRLPGGAVEKVKKVSGMNTVTSSKTGATRSYPVSHEKYGCDIRIYYDPDAAPANKYEVQFVDKKTPLDEEELAYLKWDLSDLANEATEQEVRRDFEGWAQRMGIKTSKKRKHDVEELDEDLDEDEGFDGDDEDEDEDDAPRSKKGKKAPAKKVAAKKSSKKSRRDEDEDDEDEDEEDEDDFDDEDDEDDEEDERPAKKSKKAPAKKTSKKSRDEDDEDDEDEDEDDEDDEEDDFDEEDEDEDDEPPAKSKSKKKVAAKKTSKKAPAKSKRSRDDEDEDEDEDDEEDDFDDEDDEDDEPPAKSKKKAPAKKAAKKVAAKKSSKKRSRDEDDEDEDEEDDE